MPLEEDDMDEKVWLYSASAGGQNGNQQTESVSVGTAGETSYSAQKGEDNKMTKKFCDICGKHMDRSEDIRYISYFKLKSGDDGYVQVPTNIEIELCSICQVKLIEMTEAYRENNNK